MDSPTGKQFDPTMGRPRRGKAGKLRCARAYTKNPFRGAGCEGVKAEDITYNNPVPVAKPRPARSWPVLVSSTCARFLHPQQDDDGEPGRPMEIAVGFRKVHSAYDWEVSGHQGPIMVFNSAPGR